MNVITFFFTECYNLVNMFAWYFSDPMISAVTSPGVFTCGAVPDATVLLFSMNRIRMCRRPFILTVYMPYTFYLIPFYIGISDLSPS